MRNLREATVFAGVGGAPGAQGGTTWAQKSRSRGVRTAKITLNRVTGGVRTVKVRPVRLDCLSELWKSLELSQKSDHGRGKVYLSDQSYD